VVSRVEVRAGEARSALIGKNLQPIAETNVFWTAVDRSGAFFEHSVSVDSCSVLGAEGHGEW
jgi:hypothetical protein